MNFSLYVPRQTWIHGLDGRTKFLSAVGLSLIALGFSHPLYLSGVLGLVLMGMMASGVQANIRKMWVLTALLFCYSVALWPFFVKGKTPIPWLGVLGVTQEGVIVGLGMGMRLLILIWVGVWLLSTMTIESLSVTLQQLGLPGRVGFAFSLAFRWVAILLGAGVGVVHAQRSRGLDVETGGIVSRIRKYLPLVVPLMGHALRQTNLLAMALESKGFHPLAERQVLSPARLRLSDYLVIGTIGCLVGVVWWLRRQGLGVLEIHF